MLRHNCSPVPIPELRAGVIPPDCFNRGLPLPLDDFDDGKKTSTSSVNFKTCSAKSSRKTNSSDQSKGNETPGRALMKLKKKKHNEEIKNRLPKMNAQETKQYVLISNGYVVLALHYIF